MTYKLKSAKPPDLLVAKSWDRYLQQEFIIDQICIQIQKDNFSLLEKKTFSIKTKNAISRQAKTYVYY